MAELGKRNTLPILNESPHGLYLDGGDLGDILLPGPLVPAGITPNVALDVFLYLDSEDRIVATTETPKGCVGTFAALEVVGINRAVGAFLDWGLAKDLLLPFREQKSEPKQGDTVIVYIYVDDLSGRIVASERITRFLSKYRPYYAPQERVDLLVIQETPLGYKAIVNNAHIGLLYDNELAEPLRPGQRLSGYVNHIRPDGNIDLRRDRTGYSRVAPLSQQIFDALKTADDGYLPFDDKTPPEAIRERFGASKKAFKQALGGLYKRGKIQFAEGGGIRLSK